MCGKENVMYFKDLVTRIHRTTEFTKSDIEKILRFSFNNIKNFLNEEGSIDAEVSIPNFGKFKSVTRKARAGHNPKTGEPITIAARKVVVFKASKVREAKDVSDTK